MLKCAILIHIPCYLHCNSMHVKYWILPWYWQRITFFTSKTLHTSEVVRGMFITVTNAQMLIQPFCTGYSVSVCQHIGCVPLGSDLALEVVSYWCVNSKTTSSSQSFLQTHPLSFSASLSQAYRCHLYIMGCSISGRLWNRMFLRTGHSTLRAK